jgi:hypothetical protein
MTRLFNLIKSYIVDSIDARIDKLVSREIRSRLDDIDLDRQVATSIEGINWSDHIDYASLSYHIDIDHHELSKYIDLDTSEIADELTQRLHFQVKTRQ